MDGVAAMEAMKKRAISITRTQLLYMALCGLSSSQISAFLSGAEFLERKSGKTYRKDVILTHPEETVQMKRWHELESKGFWALTLFDDAYPDKLRDVEPVPYVLFGRGDCSVLTGFSLAIIGSRKPSAYGITCTNLFAGGLARNGIVVISGLAYGIDSLAHRAALQASFPTVAVLGNGIDTVYPASHRSLAEKIIQNGCLLSEYPPGEGALPYHFVQRNRLISGLSDGVLVIEANRRSGTMITVNCASEQGKNVFCVPGNIQQKLSEGTNEQIRRGATLVTGIDDIISAYDWKPKPLNEAKKVKEALTAMEGAIYDRLRLAPCGANELSRMVPLTVSDLWMCLTALEMKGKICRRSDGKFATQ